MELNSEMSLSRHITQSHKIKTEEYHNLYIKTTKNECIICGKIGNNGFTTVIKGYRLCCGRSCSAINNRRILKSDEMKFESFRNKVKDNMKHLWASTNQTERSKKAGKTIRNNNKSLSNAELKVKYGWLNKLSGKEYEEARAKLLLTGCHVWWKTAPEEVRSRVIDKRCISVLNSTKNFKRDSQIEFTKEQMDELNIMLSKVFNL